jgi:hypothetical protein
MAAIRYFDVLLLLVAAPIMLLIGVPAVGYAVGAGTWIALRAVGVAVDRYAGAAGEPRTIGVRLAYMLGRLFVLALAVILVRRGEGQNGGLAALLVIVFAYTIQLATSFANRPRKGSR